MRSLWGCAPESRSLGAARTALVWVKEDFLRRMLIVGVLGISMVDNVLRPLLLSGRTQVNGLVIFFGLLGGAAAFGFIGLVIGPIILVTTGRLLGLLLRPALSIDTR